MIKKQPLWQHVFVQNGYPFNSESFSAEGDIPLVRIRDLSDEKFETFIPHKEIISEDFLIRNGDVIVGMDGEFKSVLWTRGTAALNQRVCAIRARRETDLRFINYAIQKPLEEINNLRYSTTVKHLSQDDIYSLHIPIPAPAQQAHIADYLDRETAEIDAAVANLDRYVELLKVRERALTEDTLSKYSLSSAPIGTLGSVVLGKMLAAKPPTSDSKEHPYLRAAHVQPGGILDFSVPQKTMWFAPAEASRLDLKKNDIVIVEGGAGFGRSALLQDDMPCWGFQNSIVRVRLDRTLAEPRFVRAMLSRALNQGEIANTVDTATLPHFTAEKVAKFRIPYVSVDAQRKIADTLTTEHEKSASLIADATKLRDLLLKRRSVLITEVVTGRKKV